MASPSTGGANIPLPSPSLLAAARLDAHLIASTPDFVFDGKHGQLTVWLGRSIPRSVGNQGLGAD